MCQFFLMPAASISLSLDLPGHNCLLLFIYTSAGGQESSLKHAIDVCIIARRRIKEVGKFTSSIQINQFYGRAA